ncbi:MAG: hypothetical protein GAK32_02445 [Pseudomonas fluorescens]|nr:MAG: hypothetical protein GAK32_02445 [Pseudomonas fluorescens]
MGDEQAGQFQPCLEIAQQREDLCLYRNVQCRHRLIAHQHLRVARQGPGDGNALALAARQFQWATRQQAGFQAYQLEQFQAASGPFAARQPTDLQCLVEYAGHGVPWVERALRVLEHHLNALTLFAPLPSAQAVPGATVEPHIAGVGRFQAQQHAGDSGFAGTGLTHDSQRFAGAQTETGIVHGHMGMAIRAEVGLLQVASFDQWQVEALGHGTPGRLGGRTLKMHGAARVQQRLGIGVSGVMQNRLYRPLLHDHPVMHHRHTVCQARHHRQVMADHQHRHRPGAQGLQQSQHLRLHRGIQRGRGFVGDQQARVARNGRCDQRPLAQATGQLVGILQRPSLGLWHADGLEQLDHPRVARGTVQIAMQAQGLGDFLAHCPQRVQRAQRVLHHKADLCAAQALPCTVIELAQIRSIERQPVCLNLGACARQAAEGA